MYREFENKQFWNCSSFPEAALCVKAAAETSKRYKLDFCSKRQVTIAHLILQALSTCFGMLLQIVPGEKNKILANLLYFTNLGFPEIRGFPLLNDHLGEIGSVRSL